MDSRLRTPNHIFECYVELVRQNEEEGPEVAVTYLYPKDYQWEEDTKRQLPKFAFSSSQSSDTEEHFTFVLTDLQGKYRFGFCRYPPKGETCMCFLSDFPWYKIFYRVLDKISDLRHDFQSEIVEPFLSGLRSHDLPNLGVDSVLSIVPDDVDAGQVYTFPLPNPKKLAEIPSDHNLTYFYTSLHHTVILHLFANMIFERRIIMTSSSFSLLSSAVHGAVILLYPLHWQHIFIPITPSHLIDYCAAPMPFLMGVHSSLMNRVLQMPLDDVVILDIDESTIESPHCEDLNSLPPDVIATLKHVLKKQSSAYGHTVSKAFMLAQVSMLGGYRSALKLRPGDKEVVFDEESFLQSRPNMEEFLRELLHFQHFRQFINCRIERLKSKKQERDLFDSEVLLYEDELKGTTQEHLKAAFEKFVSSTVEGSKWLWDKSEKVRVKGWKTTKNLVKRKIRPDKDKIDKDYPGQTIANTALLLQSDEKYKYHSLPDTRRPSDSQPKLRRPPPAVIPYHRHVEGKRKLVETLRQSGIYSVSEPPDSARSTPEVPIGSLLSFTPPDTPRAVQSAEQSSLDRYERASLDSKTSTEASVASGEIAAEEVATGNLIDIASTASEGPTKDDTERRAESPISTASSSSEDSIPEDWERFENNEFRPPLPPPRSSLDTQPGNQQRLAEDSPVQDASESQSSSSSLNPFETDIIARTSSPFDDFGTSVAQSLISSSRRFSDPFAADTLATMSSDLMKTLGVVSEEGALPTPLVPTSSSGNPTSNALTALPRSSPQVGTARISRSTLGVSAPFLSNSSPNLVGQSTLVNGVSADGSSLALKTTSASVGNSPQSTSVGSSPLKCPSPSLQQHQPLLQPLPAPVPNFTSNPAIPDLKVAPSGQSPSPSKRPPPPKPQPYTGAAANIYREQQIRDSSNPFAPPKYDPFGSLFGDGGLEAYASGSLVASQAETSPVVNAHDRDTTRV